MKKFTIIFVSSLLCLPLTAQKRKTIDRDKPTIVTKTQKKNVAKHSSPTVTRKQKGKSIAQKKKVTETPYLSVSANSVSFSSQGGSKTFYIYSNSTWKVDIGTASWGNLSRNGNNLTLSVTANTSSSARTDYFTIKSGRLSRRVDISQLGSSPVFAKSGTYRDYVDNATALKFISSTINERQRCRIASITEKGNGVIVCDKSWSAWNSINSNLSDKLKELANTDYRISTIAITASGYYCVAYGINGWYGNVPSEMKNILNKFNSDGETILSVSISEGGNFVVVTDKHFHASNTSDYSNIIAARDLYGQIKTVCTTSMGICIVCDRGVYYKNIPKNLATKLNSLDYKPYIITFTDSGTYIIANEDGTKYNYHI